MAIALAQEVQGQDPNFSTNGTTIAATITAAAGSWLHVLAFGNGSSGMTASVSDGTNTYTAIGDVFQSGHAYHWYTGPVAGGTYTITVTFSATINLKGILVKELTSVSGYQTHIEAGPATPGAGTDAITSGSMTPSSQPAMVSALCLDTFFGATPAAGTGYTSTTGGALLGKCWDWGDGTANSYARTEVQRITSTSGIAATFTSSAGGTNKFCVLAAIFTESAAAAAQVPYRRQQWVPQADEEIIPRRRLFVPPPAGAAPVRVPYRRPTVPQEEPPQFLFMGMRSATIQSGATVPDSPPLGWPQRVISMFRTYEEDPGRFRRPVVTPSAPSDNPPWGNPRRVQGMYALQYIDPQDQPPRYPRLTASGAVNPPAPAPTPSQPTNTGPFDWRADYAAIIGQMFRGGGYPHQT